MTYKVFLLNPLMDLNNKKKTLEINVSKRIKFEKLENSVSKRKDLTVSEFSFLLPSAFTFDQSKMDISALTLLQKYGTFNEKETSFFIKMVQTTDQEEEQVYKLLLNLLKGDRKKKKKAVKNLCKIKNHKLIVEKIILMIIFLGKISTTEYLLKIVDFLYLKHRENFNCWVEVVFLLTIFLEDENLQNYAYKILSNILIFDTNRITLLVEQEINTEDQNIQKIVSRLLFLLIINKGYNTVIDMFITNNNTIMRVLEAHYFIFKYVDIEIVDLKNEIFIFLKKILLKNNIRFTIEIGNILSYYCLQGFMNDKDCLRWFNDIIKIFRNVFNETKYSNVKKEKFYKMSLLRTCAVLSANNQESSKTIYDFLALWDDFDKNNIKIFYRIFENLCYEDVESYILKYFSFFFDQKYVELKKKIFSIFHNILPNIKIEYHLIDQMLTNDLILELITKTDTFKIEDKSLFIENVYLLVRQNSISCCRNVLKLGKLCHFTKLEWYKMFEYCKHKIYDPDEKIQILGYKICNQIIEEIEGKDLKIFGIFLYEKLDKSNDIILSKQLNTLTKIYEKNPFYDTKDLLLELGSILKLKNDDIKYSCINFMSVILKNQNCQNISKTEFMRISYDIMSYLSFWYLKKKHCGIVLLAQISDIIPPQELINIFLEFLESNDKNIKKGLIDGIAYLSNHVGLFNVLPVLLTDYKYVDDKVKLIIIRVLTKCKVTKRYLAYFNCIVEDSVVNPNINFRIEGIKLCTALLDQTDMDMEIITHYLNLVWFNILEKNILIQQEFNKYIKTFTKRFSSQFLLKYVIQGVFHPSKKVRQRYLEIYDILKKNDNNTDEYIKILCQKIY